MARKGTGLAVAIGAAIAIGAVVAFASGSKRQKEADEIDEAEDEADEAAAEPSPVLPTAVTPPFVPPIQVSFPTPATPGTPPVAPPVEPTTPTPDAVPPVVELPDEDEDEDEDEDDEADSPTVVLPGGVKVQVPKAGTTVTLPGGIQATVPSIPGVTEPPETPAAVPSPPTPAIEQPSAVPADTAALASRMLADEGTPNWKKKYPDLGAWQASRGLKVDQKYGPGSAQRMAQEIGTLPIIRYWPKGSTRATALEPYRNAILTLAGSAPEPRKAQLIMSANREQGQSFSAPSSPIKTLVNLKAAAA